MKSDPPGNPTQNDWLKLHFSQSNNAQVDVPVQVLLRGLASVSRLVYLLAGSFRNHPYSALQDATALRNQFESQLKLVCGQTETGSYIVPLRLKPNDQSTHTDLVATDAAVEEELTRFKSFFDQTVDVVARGDVSALENSIPESSNVKRIVSAIHSTMPTEGFNLAIASESWREAYLLDTLRDRDAVGSLFDHTRNGRTNPKLREEHLTVVAQLEAYDLVRQTYRARSREGIVIRGNADTDLASAKVKLTPQRIEFDGIFEVDENDNIQSIKAVESSRRVDVSPIEVTEIRANNELLRAEPPLRYKVGFLRSDSCYYLEGDLGLSLHAFSRAELENALDESLESWWLNYALEEDMNLSSGARKLKRELISRFQMA